MTEVEFADDDATATVAGIHANRIGTVKSLRIQSSDHEHFNDTMNLHGIGEAHAARIYSYFHPPGWLIVGLFDGVWV